MKAGEVERLAQIHEALVNGKIGNTNLIIYNQQTSTHTNSNAQCIPGMGICEQAKSTESVMLNDRGTHRATPPHSVSTWRKLSRTTQSCRESAAQEWQCQSITTVRMPGDLCPLHTQGHSQAERWGGVGPALCCTACCWLLGPPARLLCGAVAVRQIASTVSCSVSGPRLGEEREPLNSSL